MQPRTFFGLLLVTLLAIVAAAVVLATGRDGGHAGAGGEPAFPRLQAAAAEATEIAIAGVAGEVQLRRGADGIWSLPAKGGYPADPRQVRQLLLDAGKLRLAELKTDNPARLHRLWLDDPDKPGAQSLRLTITAADGSLLADAVVGRTTNDLVAQQEGGTYLRYPEEARAWLAAGRLSLSPDPLDYLDRGLVDLPADSIRRVVVTRADGSVILAERARGEPALAVKTGLPDGQAADPKALANFANLLDGLVFADVAPAEAVAFPAEAINVTVTSFDGIELRLELAVVDQVPWARLTAVLGAEHGTDPERLKGIQDFIDAVASRTAGWAFRLAPAAFQRLAPTGESLTRAP